MATTTRESAVQFWGIIGGIAVAVSIACYSGTALVTGNNAWILVGLGSIFGMAGLMSLALAAMAHFGWGRWSRREPGPYLPADPVITQTTRGVKTLTVPFPGMPTDTTVGDSAPHSSPSALARPSHDMTTFDEQRGSTRPRRTPGLPPRPPAAVLRKQRAERERAEKQKREHLAQLHQAGVVIHDYEVETMEDAMVIGKRAKDWIRTTADWIEANYSTADRSIFLDTSNLPPPAESGAPEYSRTMKRLDRHLSNLIKILERDR